MPDKDGAEEKTTKSVVSKRQKQMMGEEGYDIARDMGRVRPSKDKKDATTMPPSKEMEKTRKVNKGPSALERVKKKYKGQIMKMEELDLTQVAEAFGGYIVEAPKTPKPGSFEFSKELGPKGKYQTSNIVKRMMQAFPPPGTGGKVGSAADAEVEKQITAARADKKAAQMAGMDALADKITGGSKPRKTDDPKRVVQQTFPGFEGSKGKTRKKRSDAGQPRGRSRRRYLAAPGQLQLDFTKKADRKQVKQDIAAVAKEPMKKAVIPTLRTAAKGAKATLTKAVKNPIGTAIVAGIARDSFRMPQLPPMPKVSGGKVGRRTAG